MFRMPFLGVSSLDLGRQHAVRLFFYGRKRNCKRDSGQYKTLNGKPVTMPIVNPASVSRSGLCHCTVV